MDAKWVPAVHFTTGRESPVRRIVLHWMATNLAGCDATFTGGQREASAHYGIEGSTVHQYVREQDTAWHAGNRAINHESIGIEHSAQPGRDASEATIATSVALCTELCRRYNLTADAIGYHSQFYATQCPGTLPVARIRDAVRANLTKAETPALTLEDDLSAAADEIKDYIGKLLVTGYTVAGQPFPGVAKVDIETQRRVTALAAQVSALSAAVKALAESKGADSAAILAAVESATAKALSGLEITLSNKETA